MTNRACPVAACISRRKPGHLMCREHWYLVPVATRREVNEAWRLVNANRDPMHLPDDMARYRAVRQAAIDAVNAKYAEASS